MHTRNRLPVLSIRPMHHELRRTFASQMAESVEPKAVQERLGLAHPSSTLDAYFRPDLRRTGNEFAAGMETVVAAYEASQLRSL